MARKIFHISFEGLPGCGKTTLLTRMQEEIKSSNLCDKFDIFYEPLEVWTGFGSSRTNVLECMYVKPKQNAYLFQNLALASKIHQLKFLKPVNLVERSIYSQEKAFIPLLYQAGNLTSLEKEVLDYSIDSMKLLESSHIDLYIYINCAPQLALERMRIRARKEEQEVGLDVLHGLHTFHSNWLLNSDLSTPVWVVDAKDPDPKWLLNKIINFTE